MKPIQSNVQYDDTKEIDLKYPNTRTTRSTNKRFVAHNTADCIISDVQDKFVRLYIDAGWFDKKALQEFVNWLIDREKELP